MSSIKLSVQGLGHVPSFKNSKMLIGGKKPRLITDPKKRKWMDQCQDALVSQLLYLCPTIEGETLTDALPRFLTASLPQDDCWQNVPELSVRVVYVSPGAEGAEITIEPIDEP